MNEIYIQNFMKFSIFFMITEQQRDDENIEPNENNHQPTQLPLSISKFKGITYRKRANPLVSTKDSYQIHRTTKHSIKGTRVYFQFKKDNQILYSTKMKGKRPDDPLPISSGSEMHYSSDKFAGYLLSGNKHTIYSLRAQTTFGKELISILFESPNGDKTLPKKISVTFFLKDSLVPTKLVNLEPTLNEDGGFELNFHNKKVIPSIKNCILINQENKCEFLILRKTSDDIVEIEAVNVISPLAVFAFALSLYECPF